MASVFIGSTSLDLSAYRAAAIEVCNRLGLVPVAMEFFEAMGVGASAGSLTKLDTTDVYVGIFAHRYGYIEPGHSASVAELEFDHACARGLERLCFIVKPDFAWPPAAIDHAHYDNLTRFKERINQAVIRQQFTTVDDFTGKLIQSLSEWQKRQADPAALEAILDLFATRRAFFHGDEKALAHVVEMLDFNDAGRAVAVARSLAEVAAQIERELSRLRSSTHASLKHTLAGLIVACKDYAETYGTHRGDSFLALPHIGWRQRIEDFTEADSRFGFSSTDSFEVFKTLLEYISRSFSDLMGVRARALAVVECIAKAEPTLGERSGNVRALLAEGADYLKTASMALDRSARLVERVISTSTDFQARRAAAATLSQEQEDQTVARLLAAISKVRNPTAWSRRSAATTLVSFAIASDYTLQLSFADGLTASVRLDNDNHWQYTGRQMTPAEFRLAQLDVGGNLISWNCCRGLFVTGEGLRQLAESDRKPI